MAGIMANHEGIQAMTVAILPCAEGRLALNLSPWPDLSDAGFAQLCAANPDLRLERTAEGEIVIMAPTGWEAGQRNAAVTAVLHAWAHGDGSGLVADSSTGFRLPDGAILSPDVAWLRRERLQGLSAAEREGFLPLAPDFVVELSSSSDRPAELQAKMAAYIANGVRLGWLIDPYARTVTAYRPEVEPRRLEGVGHIAGDPELPGFVLDLEALWGDHG